MLGLDFSGSDATEWLSVKTTGSGRPLDSLTGRGERGVAPARMHLSSQSAEI